MPFHTHARDIYVSNVKRPQRKTRCDPTLPRCLPCERSGSICEYFDTTKGKKINRLYVVKLQEKVRALETELGHYTDEDDFPKNNEDFVRPGGLVRLNETDETPRYLGPSSGIAMTRLLMEEAKRYTDSARISELIPELRDRRRPDALDQSSADVRMSSFSVLPPAASRRKSYPMISAVPAGELPSRAISDKLIEVFYQRGKLFNKRARPLGVCLNYSSSEFPDVVALQVRYSRQLCMKDCWRLLSTTSMREIQNRTRTLWYDWSWP